MDLIDILGPDAFLQSTVNKESPKFCLLLSHGSTLPEPVICNLIDHFLQSTNKMLHGDLTTNSAVNTVAKSQTMDHAFHYLFILFRKPGKLFQDSINAVSKHQTDKSQCQLLDISSIVQKYKFDFSDQTTNENNNQYPFQILNNNLATKLFDHIHSEIENFMKNCEFNSLETKRIQNAIFIDNLTNLLDFGLNPLHLEHLLTICLQKTRCSNLLITVGLHIGNDFQDLMASDYESNFMHLIELWKERASILIETTPLSTGYTPSLDGQLSYRLNSKESTQNFHYRLIGKRIRCCAPGTCELFT